MEAEYVLILVVAIGLALVAGFIGGRMSAPGQRRVKALEKERDAARAEAETIRAEVSRHFEESARMFGKLANDYRSFFQQFARTAQNLGLSEGRARQLLQQADPSLVSSDQATATARRPGETRAPVEAEEPQGPGEAGTAESPGEGEQPARDTTASRTGDDQPSGPESPSGEPERQRGDGGAH